MTEFVLDNSVAMRWFMESEKESDQAYSEAVLSCLVDTDALVPNLWHLEAANVLLGAERQGVVNAGEVERFVYQLENLPIYVDPVTAQQAFGRTRSLARAYGLSSYDAAYLELAIRENLPLATLDARLVKSAHKAEIEIHLKP